MLRGGKIPSHPGRELPDLAGVNLSSPLMVRILSATSVLG